MKISGKNMTRIEEMKKDGYTLQIYNVAGDTEKKLEKVAYFLRFHTGLWIVYDVKDNEIGRFILKDFSGYEIITKNKY